MIASFHGLGSLSFFLHSRSKGVIFDASNTCLHCFPFPLVGEIPALIVIFSWLVGCVKPLKFKGLLACRALNCIS